MSHRKDSDSSSNYNAILASVITYLQSINTWYEYLVFSSLILSLLLGLDLYSNEGHIIKSLLQPYTTARNLPYRGSDRDYLTSVNLIYPGTGLGIIPCRSTLPPTHRVLKVLGGNGDMCRVLVINKDASPEAISQSLEYFSTSNRDN